MFEKSMVVIKEMISKKDFSFLVFALSIFILPLSINFSTFTFILALTLKLVQVVFRGDKLLMTKGLKHSAIIGLVFFVYIQVSSLIQLGWEDHFGYFEKLYQHFSLFCLTPILFRTKRENELILHMLFLGLFVAVIWVFGYALINDVTFDKNTFTNVLDIHHTYLSMYILTFVNYGIVKIITNKNEKNINHKIGFIILGILSLFVMYLLDSKVGMLIFVVLFILHSLPELSKKNTWYYVTFLILILVVLSAFINKVGVNYEKALDFRLQIWEVSFKEFEDNPITGNLKLPEKDILNFHHYLNGKYYFLDSDLNSHNQFLSILMRFGLIGFFILFLYGVNVFNKTNPNTSRIDVKELFGFFIIVLVICYIENILDRHHGIVYVTIFYNYYLVAIENAKT